MGRVSVRRKSASVVKGRLGEGQMQLRRGGDAHRFYCSLSKTERLDFLQTVGIKVIQRVGHDRGIDTLRNCAAELTDLSQVDDFLILSQDTKTMWIIGEIFGPRLNEVWDQASQTLGIHADAPTVGHLQNMCEVLMEEFSPTEVRLFLAAAFEVKMPCHKELVELSEADHPWSKFLSNTCGDDTPASTPLVIEVDEATKVKRRERRREERKQRSAQRQQRDQSEQTPRLLKQRAKNGDQQTQSESVPEEGGFDGVPLEISRIAHPHLDERATNESKKPVGYVWEAYISWGPKAGEGKKRPVLVIASNRTRVWVRPIFTNDYKAGLWRSVIINDWEQAGLDHQSYVSVDILELSARKCTVGKAKLTLEDWNRVCRGEVHE